jgi:hypothetical protein
MTASGGVAAKLLPAELGSYISGFADGEGCFCISFQPSRRHRHGWEVRPSFSISQNADRAELLYVIRGAWSCGFIRPDRSDKTLKFEVRQIGDLVTKVVPHFRSFPLRSSKRSDFERFAAICAQVCDRAHLSPQGLKQIALSAASMNPSGKRKYRSEEILRSISCGRDVAGEQTGGVVALPSLTTVLQKVPGC